MRAAGGVEPLAVDEAHEQHHADADQSLSLRADSGVLGQQPERASNAAPNAKASNMG